MKDRVFLLLYILGLVLVSSLSYFDYLLFILIFLLLTYTLTTSPGRFKKTIKPIFFALFTTLVISTPYAPWTGHYMYVPILALRMLDIMLLTFLALAHMNLYSALSFSKSLSQLLVLTSSFMILYKRLIMEFKQALKSRSPEGIKKEDIINLSGSIGSYFLERALRDSEEVANAIKSRGFELD